MSILAAARYRCDCGLEAFGEVEFYEELSGGGWHPLPCPPDGWTLNRGRAYCQGCTEQRDREVSDFWRAVRGS